MNVTDLNVIIVANEALVKLQGLFDPSLKGKACK